MKFYCAQVLCATGLDMELNDTMESKSLLQVKEVGGHWDLTIDIIWHLIEETGMDCTRGAAGVLGVLAFGSTLIENATITIALTLP